MAEERLVPETRLPSCRYLCGRTLTPEQPGGAQQEVHMLWTPVPPALTLGEGQEDATWEFLTVVGGSQAEAQACLAEALQLQARHALYTAHAQAWAQLWADCGLDVEGPLALRQALRGALYYLLSALPQPGASGYVCHGLSPGGLSNGSRGECYWGHVFWDQVRATPTPSTRQSTCTAGLCSARLGLRLERHRDVTGGGLLRAAELQLKEEGSDQKGQRPRATQLQDSWPGGEVLPSGEGVTVEGPRRPRRLYLGKGTASSVLWKHPWGC